MAPGAMLPQQQYSSPPSSVTVSSFRQGGMSTAPASLMSEVQTKVQYHLDMLTITMGAMRSDVVGHLHLFTTWAVSMWHRLMDLFKDSAEQILVIRSARPFKTGSNLSSHDGEAHVEIPAAMGNLGTVPLASSQGSLFTAVANMAGTCRDAARSGAEAVAVRASSGLTAASRTFRVVSVQAHDAAPSLPSLVSL